tara:strand:- start:819 stop:1292 length:474 start_codon:yes stop_codon:yes gene_type:complete
MNYYRLIILILLSLNIGCNETYIANDTNIKVNITSIEQLADNAYNNQVWEDVIKYYRKLIKISPHEPELFFRVGNAHSHLGETDSAIVAYKKALETDRFNSKILHNLGVAQLRESTKTFVKLKEHTNLNDPLNTRSRLVINAIVELLNKESMTKFEN